VAAALPPGRPDTGLFSVPASWRLTPYLVAGEVPLLVLIAAGGVLRAAKR
jgi:hypothetical protein